MAENLGPDPIAFAQFQMDATGALNVLRLTVAAAKPTSSGGSRGNDVIGLTHDHYWNRCPVETF